nr:MAG TPA: hypothetical protein [Caudoviricetes sp.]
MRQLLLNTGRREGTAYELMCRPIPIPQSPIPNPQSHCLALPLSHCHTLPLISHFFIDDT